MNWNFLLPSNSSVKYNFINLLFEVSNAHLLIVINVEFNLDASISDSFLSVVDSFFSFFDFFLSASIFFFSSLVKFDKLFLYSVNCCLTYGLRTTSINF